MENCKGEKISDETLLEETREEYYSNRDMYIRLKDGETSDETVIKLRGKKREIDEKVAQLTEIQRETMTSMMGLIKKKIEPLLEKKLEMRRAIAEIVVAI